MPEPMEHVRIESISYNYRSMEKHNGRFYPQVMVRISRHAFCFEFLFSDIEASYRGGIPLVFKSVHDDVTKIYGSMNPDDVNRIYHHLADAP